MLQSELHGHHIDGLVWKVGRIPIIKVREIAKKEAKIR